MNQNFQNVYKKDLNGYVDDGLRWLQLEGWAHRKAESVRRRDIEN